MRQIRTDWTRIARCWAAVFTLSAFATILPMHAQAVIPAGIVSVSPDVSVEYAGTLVHDEEIAVDNLLGLVLDEGLGAESADALDAYHLESNGDRLLSFETTVELPGAVIAEPGDVVRFDGGAYSIEFDGSAEGLPQGADVDAVSRDGAGQLLVSFDTSVLLSGTHFDDEDLARFQAGAFTMAFDASSQGVPEELDLDGVHAYPWADILFVSFDGSGEVGGVTFDDEDVVEFFPVTGTWTLSYDASTLHAAAEAADSQAVHIVPEPGWASMSSAGALALGWLARRRARSRPRASLSSTRVPGRPRRR